MRSAAVTRPRLTAPAEWGGNSQQSVQLKAGLLRLGPHRHRDTAGQAAPQSTTYPPRQPEVRRHPSAALCRTDHALPGLLRENDEALSRTPQTKQEQNETLAEAPR